MKSRPRTAENKIADQFSNVFIKYGYEPVIRIPVLGRTGPDLTINETKLVIDAKSRIQTPVSFIIPCFVTHGNLLALPISKMDTLCFYDPQPVEYTSKIIGDWLDHMNEWTVKNVPDGISGITLHRPKLAFDKAVLVFYKSDLERFRNLWKTNN